MSDKAERIARDLMTGGADNLLADSLTLYRDGRYLGAWSLLGLAIRIRKHLSGELDAMDRETVDLNEEAFLDGGDWR